MHRRQATLQRIAQVHLSSMGKTVGETIGHGKRQRLAWLGLLAMPLLIPVALPGMASAVGVLCLFVAYSLCGGQPKPLPAWLARQTLNERVQSVLVKSAGRAMQLLGRLGRPRLLALSNQPFRLLHGGMLALAGVSMAIPVPMISFDNVLPALAVVLITWGLRLRDGLMLLAGYLATACSVASVGLLWWGGTALVSAMWTWVST